MAYTLDKDNFSLFINDKLEVCMDLADLDSDYMSINSIVITGTSVDEFFIDKYAKELGTMLDFWWSDKATFLGSTRHFEYMIDCSDLQINFSEYNIIVKSS